MKKYVIAVLTPVLFAGVAVISMSWFFARKNEQFVQDLTRRCVERGSVASSSIERGLLTYHINFSCVAKAK